MNIAIICDGQFPRREWPLWVLGKAEHVICCDGALATYLRRTGRVPDAVVGDMDSLPKSLQKRFKDILVPISEQENNDQTKAVLYALEHWQDAKEIHIFGASGKREDHTIGNMSLLMEYERSLGLSKRGITIDAISDWSTATVISDSTSLTVGEGRRISVLTCDQTLRIKSEGLQWPLDDVIFDNWWRATLNRASSDQITLTLSHPAPVLLIMD